MLARRLSVAVLVALVALAGWCGASQAAGVKWVTKQIGWASPAAGVALSSGGFDTLMVLAEDDSNRTVVVNTGDWAWEALLPGAATSAANPCAIITVTGARVNAAAESLYVIPEKCYRGACARSVLAAGTWTTTNLTALTPFGMTGATWGTWSAGSTATIPYTLASNAVVMYQGPLHVDMDEVGGTNSTLFGSPEFRLNVIGDIGGTTPQVNRARVYITYPQRSQP